MQDCTALVVQSVGFQAPGPRLQDFLHVASVAEDVLSEQLKPSLIVGRGPPAYTLLQLFQFIQVTLFCRPSLAFLAERCMVRLSDFRL